MPQRDNGREEPRNETRNRTGNHGARTFRMGANQTLLLDQREEVWIVDKGYVNVFAALMDHEGRVLRRQPLVGRVDEGDGFCGGGVISSAVHPERFIALLAAPSRDAVLRARGRREFADRDNFDLEAVALIENWISTLSEFTGRYGGQLPDGTALIEADPDVPYDAGANISAPHRGVLWVKATQALHYLGEDVVTLEPVARLPLTERTWFFLPEAAKVSAVLTPGAIQLRECWPSVDRLSGIVLRLSEWAWEARLEGLRERARQHLESTRAARDEMFGKLARILNAPSPASGAAAVKREPLHASIETVVTASGAALGTLGRAPKGETDPRRVVAHVAHPSGVRVRGIRLEADWAERDGSSFLAFEEGDERRPFAVIRRPGGGYESHDPETGARTHVDREFVRRTARTAIRLYAPLAEGISTGMAAFRQAMLGNGRDAATVITMGILSALVALLVPVVTGNLLGEFIPRLDWPMWIASLIALGLGAITTAAFGLVNAFAMLRIESRVDEELQSSVWGRLLSLPAPFFRRYLAGDLADRANSVSTIRQVLTGTTAAAVLSGVFSLFSYGLLFYYNVELALWAGAIMTLMAGATWFFATRQIVHFREAFKAQGTLDGLVVQMIAGISKLRQANSEVHLLKRWADLYAKQKKDTLKARQWSAGQVTFNALFGPLATMAILGLIWYNLLAIEDPVDFSLADFLSFHSAFGQFLAGITGLTVAWTAVVTIVPLFERVQPILEAKPEPSGAQLEGIRGHLEFQDVTFRYPSGRNDVLRKLSFEIRPNERVAFVGASGSGKSTIVRLLLGFEQAASGAVLVDGHDVANLDMGSVRRQMGVVLQHMDVFSGSIFKNIASNVPLTLREAWEAARLTGLDADIKAMPMQMNTLLSEGGKGMSGGQKQRLLLARALAPRPHVLLLDEPTSMLDNRSQAIIQRTLRSRNATQVILAHRLTTVREVDRIYVMDDGRIVESGSFDQLMAQDGLFALLASRQLV